jgi:hypothetical protein
MAIGKYGHREKWAAAARVFLGNSSGGQWVISFGENVPFWRKREFGNFFVAGASERGTPLLFWMGRRSGYLSI